MQHPILDRDCDELVAEAEAALAELATYGDSILILSGFGRIRAARFAYHADDIELGSDPDLTAAEIVERALTAARDWTPPPTGVGLPLDDQPDFVRYAYSMNGPDRITILWSTVPTYCEPGRPDHLVLQPSPDTPPAIDDRWMPLSVQCRSCGARLTPDADVLVGWVPADQLGDYAAELTKRVYARLEDQRVDVVRRLEAELAEARRRIADAGTDPAHVTPDALADALAESWARCGSEEEPGVYVAGNRLAAWDYTQGIEEHLPEVVTVYA
jgi:hypothetical protein